MIGRNHLAGITGPTRRLLRLALSAGTVAVLGAFSASGQSEVILCLAPNVPMTALTDEVIAQYRAEIAVEFETYFGEFSSYIACLDDERDRALTEAREATEAYASFLKTFPARKALP